MTSKQKAFTMNSKGQAMVETLITTVFLTIIAFATMQLVIMVVNDLTMNEAAFAISRVAVVSKTDEVPTKTRIAAALVVLTQINPNNINFIAYDVPVEGKDIPGSHSGNVAKYSTTVKYVQSIMFGSLLSGSQIMSIGNVNLIKNTSRAWMVKSPDEDYYDKAYPDAPNY